jgi:hypothetical protein
MYRTLMTIAGQALIALVSGLAILVRDETLEKFTARLDRWYAHVEGNWDDLVRWVAATNEQVLARLLGQHIVSWRFALSATALSAALSITSLVLAVLWVEGPSIGSLEDAWWLVQKPMVLSGLAVNCAIDVVTLAVTRWAFRRFIRRPAPPNAPEKRQSIGEPLAVMFAAFYLPGIFAALMWMAITQDRGSHLVEIIFWPAFVLLSANRAALFVIVLPATYSSLLFVLSLFAAVFVDYTRPVTRRPIVKALEFCRKEPFRVWFASFVILNVIVNVSVAVVPDLMQAHVDEASARRGADAPVPASTTEKTFEGWYLGSDGDAWQVTNPGVLRFETPDDHQSIHTAWIGHFDERARVAVLPAERYGSTITVTVIDENHLSVRYYWDVIGRYSDRTWTLRRYDFYPIDRAIDVALRTAANPAPEDCWLLQSVLAQLPRHRARLRWFDACADPGEQLALAAAAGNAGWSALAGTDWPERISRAVRHARRGRLVVAAWAPARIAIVRPDDDNAAPDPPRHHLTYVGRLVAPQPECPQAGPVYKDVSLSCVVPREAQETVAFYEYQPKAPAPR